MFGRMKTQQSNFTANLLIGFLGIQATWLIICLIPEIRVGLRLSMLLAATLLAATWFGYVRKFVNSVVWFTAISTGLVALAAILNKLIQPFAKNILHFLSLGIDNDPHVQMFKDILLSNGQFQAISYPPGQRVIWNLFAKLSGIEIQDSSSVILAFGTMTIFTWLVILALSILLIIRQSNFSFESFTKNYALVAIFLFGSFSYMLVGGYPHYMWATVVILMVANLFQEPLALKTKLLILVLASWILFFTMAVFAAITGICLVVMLIREIKTQLKGKTALTQLQNTVFSFIFLSFLILVSFWAIKKFKLDWISVDASAEPISFVQISATVLLAAFILRFSAKDSVRINFENKILIAALVFLSLIITVVAWLEANKVTYYAVKQIQFSLFIILAIFISAINISKNGTLVKFAISVLMLVQFIPAIWPKSFDGAIMGSGIKGFVSLTRPDSWKTITFDANSLIAVSDKLNLNQSECAVFWNPESVLISKTTWINAINPNGKHVCHSFGFLEFTNSESEIVKVADNLDQQFVVLFTKTNKPDVEEISSSNIRLFELTN